MKFLGIDYGTKKVGIAVSDSEGKFAFPKKVLPYNDKLENEIETVVKDEKIEKIIIGESIDYKGRPNIVMQEIKAIKKELEEKLGLEVILQNETLSSRQARNFQGSDEMLDARSAAIILQSYLDRNA